MRKLYFHLGYPKTATTYLQRNFFPKIEGIRYLGRNLGLNDNIPFINEWQQYFTFSSNISFEKEMARINYLIKKEEVDSFGSIDTSKPLFISDEGLFFRALHPFDIQRVGIFSACVETILYRIKTFCKVYNYDCKILITLRNQHELIHSIYAEKYFYFQNTEDSNTIDKYLNNALSENTYYDYGLVNLEYDWIIALIDKFFGNNNSIILKYEDIKKNPNRFYTPILNFVESEQSASEILDRKSEKFSNVRKNMHGGKTANYKANSMNDTFLRILKNTSKIFGNYQSQYLKNLYSEIIKMRSKKNISIEMTDDQKNMIFNKYRESNKKLVKYDQKFAEYVPGS